MLALWDTTGTEVVHKLAAERRSAGGVASGLALTLIVIAEEARVRLVEEAAAIAASAHPCRLLIVVRDPLGGRSDAPSRLDAEIIVGGRLGPCEGVALRMTGRLALHAESVVVPLLAPDVPVVTWWSGLPPDRIAYDPLGVVSERRVTDTTQAPDPLAALRQRAEDYAPGDTDLAWTRITPWRTLVAGALDTALEPVESVTIAAAPGDPSGALLGGWLRARLGVTPTFSAGTPPGVSAVGMRLTDGHEIALERQGGTCMLRRSGYDERILPLVPRRLGDEVAEELRRLDPDQPYAHALAAATGTTGLDTRPHDRVHIWHDPALAEPEPSGTGAAA